jgi:hypothetical protein
MFLGRLFFVKFGKTFSIKKWFLDREMSLVYINPAKNTKSSPVIYEFPFYLL